MTESKTQILTDADVAKMLKRLAYQVYERNFDEKEIILAGITGKGSAMADLLAQELAEICKIKISRIEIRFNKQEPTRDSVELSEPIKTANKPVIVVDDVLNTGRTLAYALLPFVGMQVKKIETLVLVDRNHKSFPISADYIGMSLSTTLQEHVEVNIARKKVNVFLS